MNLRDLQKIAMNLKTAVSLFILALVFVFAIQNMNTVQVRFLFWSLEASRVFIYLSILLIGFFSGWLFANRRRK